MKNKIIMMACIAISALATSSCSTSSVTSGAGGSTGVNPLIKAGYVLEPVGDKIITYTIDISTPEGQQKLYNKSLAEAKQLAETEACRKYNCNRLIDPRFDYLKKGGRILRITIDGQPGVYRLPVATPVIPNKSPINVNINQ